MNFLTVDLAMAAVEEPSAKRQKIEEKPEDSAEDVSNGKEEVC